MPVQSVQRLTKDSSDSQVQAAMSECVATEVRNGREQDQAVAMCRSMIQEQVGGQPAQGGKQ